MEKRPKVVAIEGENGFYFSFFLKHSNGTVYEDLLGTETVSLWLKPTDPDVDAFSIGTGSVYNTATGEIRIAIASGDTATLTKDQYAGQIEVSGSGTLLITNDVEIHIKRRIGS